MIPLDVDFSLDDDVIPFLFIFEILFVASPLSN